MFCRINFNHGHIPSVSDSTFLSLLTAGVQSLLQTCVLYRQYCQCGNVLNSRRVKKEEEEEEMDKTAQLRVWKDGQFCKVLCE